MPGKDAAHHNRGWKPGLPIHRSSARDLLSGDGVMKSSTLEPVIHAIPTRRLDGIDSILERHLGQRRLPGLVALIYHRGHEHLTSLGTFGFESKVPMQRDTIFRLASMTKPVTAVAAMILVEECKIRLDDPVDTWLPELKDRKVLRSIDGPLEDTVPAKRRITLRDLLTFGSGYGEIGFISPASPLLKEMIAAQLPLITWPVPHTADEFMKRLGSLPLAHHPGDRWLYHMGSEILGVLIARVSGKSFGSFLHERIFDPLGMRDTDFYVPQSKLERLPACYGMNFPMVGYVDSSSGPEGELIVLHEAHGGCFSQPPVFESGGGGLVSTVDDMLAFGKMMLNNGEHHGERILSRLSIELMTMDHISPGQKSTSPFFENFWENRGWGFGMSIVTRRNDIADVPGRFGWDGAFGTSWYVDPKEELIGVFMTQRRPDVLEIPPSIRDFWTAAYQAIDD